MKEMSGVHTPAVNDLHRFLLLFKIIRQSEKSKESSGNAAFLTVAVIVQNAFQDRRLRPLGHPSEAIIIDYSAFMSDGCNFSTTF